MPTSSVCDGIMTTRTSDVLRQPTRPAGMDFSGTWKIYSEENLDEFLKVVGVPEMVIKMRKEVKPVWVIEQNGQDFTCTMKTPTCSHVNSFTIGKESEITTVDGRKFKCMIREENGKLISETEKFTSVREIQGDEMIETITSGPVTFISRSKRV
ncbi:fatty acid-binding protein, liver-like [Epinephelus fuscoguttatus]|uniref:fatty acid-binding protein, liver-like n=1 Tax=Epinephelus fuscoguttatus TaxID=293821 RepID=UPI0020D0061D|nr:fatty acid-binding protein, liver-like [Epinephelus fuscoguttatus]